jgi:hypothetical protein
LYAHIHTITINSLLSTFCFSPFALFGIATHACSRLISQWYIIFYGIYVWIWFLFKWCSYNILMNEFETAAVVIVSSMTGWSVCQQLTYLINKYLLTCKSHTSGHIYASSLIISTHPWRIVFGHLHSRCGKLLDVMCIMSMMGTRVTFCQTVS